MSKIAFIYPGQGAQKAGMGQDFYETAKARKRSLTRRLRFSAWI